MHITFTETALDRIDQLRGDTAGQLHLYYDTEGCGCGNSGIFSIRLVPAATSEDMTIDSNVGPVLVKRWSSHFLDQEMTLDYNAEKKSLILKSDGQYFNTNVLVTDQTGCQLTVNR
ncbi:iron-sulfur cluster biosynthesis family protein [Exiguobacterium antarcticum]|uniref:Iron-sulfur cluster biosynthesis family protein n=1 Tax=Exiguobacterium antarcticum TaxID=132920 RepID=A0ABT6QYB8_9BACL|nr:iron-sulfur cluster biosynthesis family protein [Exiguobacterium antarcticum]AFS71466.1 iron-sulfur-like protein [Exiguobacterium antarcticum B7]MDI3233677.1 iron-sulfur cluster biosynthesis family protein [Exiguobacterium antarcticum]